LIYQDCISYRARMDERYCIVGLGEILWDMLPDGKQLGC